MIPRSIALSLTATVLIAGCAPIEHSDRRANSDAARCDVAASEGMSESRAEAARLAEEGARQQYADARGYILGNGFRHIRVADKDIRCYRHPLARGFINCTALIRLCGR